MPKCRVLLVKPGRGAASCDTVDIPVLGQLVKPIIRLHHCWLAYSRSVDASFVIASGIPYDGHLLLAQAWNISRKRRIGREGIPTLTGQGVAAKLTANTRVPVGEDAIRV